MSAGTILIADADPELLTTLSLHLRNEEYDVTCVDDGARALEAAQSAEPDVMLIDVTLTIGDGPTLFECLGDEPELLQIPILYLVGRRAHRSGPMRLPDQVMLQKPVAVCELLEKVERAIAGSVPTIMRATPRRRPSKSDKSDESDTDETIEDAA